MNEIFLCEDHSEVLDIWRRKNVKEMDLVHVDAHIDFGFYLAEPMETVLKEARSVKELKSNLEQTLNFLHYEKDIHKQLNIGNYIYRASREDMVNDFYWVIPGGIKEFKASWKIIRNLLREIAGRKAYIEKQSDGFIRLDYQGRNFFVCTLDNLPVLPRDVLLDIDTDFLVIDSLINADNTKNIGRRKPWIMPRDLVPILKEKIKSPRIITIAYSVNGGWTPLRYKHLGDALAYCLAPGEFVRRYRRSLEAAKYFQLFEKTGKKNYYQRAIKINSRYRVTDNNFGPLYLSLKRFSQAGQEFKKILKVDKDNPSAWYGLGVAALQQKRFIVARKYLYAAWSGTKGQNLFSVIKKQMSLELGKVEFALKNYSMAEKWLLTYRNNYPLDADCYYVLGCICQHKKQLSQAAVFFKDTLRLGFPGMEPLFNLMKLSSHLAEGSAIIKYVSLRFRDFKKKLSRLNSLRLKGKKIKGLRAFENKVLRLEKQLKKLKVKDQK